MALVPATPRRTLDRPKSDEADAAVHHAGGEFLPTADDSPVTVGSGELLSRKEAASPPATARRSKLCGLRARESELSLRQCLLG